MWQSPQGQHQSQRPAINNNAEEKKKAAASVPQCAGAVELLSPAPPPGSH